MGNPRPAVQNAHDNATVADVQTHAHERSTVRWPWHRTSFRSDEQTVRASSSGFLEVQREQSCDALMPVTAPIATAILELLLSRKWGELAAYGATLSLRHNGVNGVPDSLAHKPLSRFTQALHVNRGFQAGGGCHFNFGRVESILQPSMMTTEFRPCGYQAKPPKGHVRVLDLHNCSVMFELPRAVLEPRARSRAHLCQSRPKPVQGRVQSLRCLCLICRGTARYRRSSLAPAVGLPRQNGTLVSRNAQGCYAFTVTTQPSISC